jgi:hypothetical protein
MINGGRTAVESSREHGQIAGLLTGGIKINAQLQNMIRLLSDTKFEVTAEPAFEHIPDMLTAAVAVQTDTSKLIEILAALLRDS